MQELFEVWKGGIVDVYGCLEIVGKRKAALDEFEGLDLCTEDSDLVRIERDGSLWLRKRRRGDAIDMAIWLLPSGCGGSATKKRVKTRHTVENSKIFGKCF